MLFGAGLMFGFTHTEVSAESEGNTPEQFVCSDKSTYNFAIFHCETKTLDCAFSAKDTSCVKKGMFK
jgi:hypothetical protein